MNHTPGPWHVCEGNRHIISDSHHMKVAEAAQIVSGNLSTMKTEYFPGHRMQDANANLIAAAPDLLRLLQESVSTLADTRRPIEDWLNEARAVIRKATGVEQ